MGFDSGVQARPRAPGASARAWNAAPGQAPRARAAVRALPRTRRYQILEEAGLRRLVCLEAPTVVVRIERGRCVRASEARHAPPGTIFLDGAAACEPFADPVRGVYNLDHHEGCVRPFTLSACEQAMVLLLRGLDLRKREWDVVANDADLDAVLAIWVLLNHHRLTAGDGAARAEILPLLRLEGAIDAHGLAFQEFCALPPGLLDETRRRMERLRDCERGLRAAGRWEKVDLLEYTRERLEQIDALVYPQDAFADLIEIEELGRVALEGGSVALACRAHVGIYEVERQLARFHGPRLGLLVLRQREGVYTLRQTDPALPGRLEALYAHLNRIDPAARARQADRRWGGSDEIGGSPRSGGSKLTHDAVLAACRHVYARPPLVRRLAVAALACVAAAAVPVAALAAMHAPAWPGAPTGALAFGIVLAALAAGCFGQSERRVRGLHGWRRPTGLRWLGALPFALAGALAGGVWVPVAAAGVPLSHAALASLLCAGGAELLFRGFLHGRLTACAAPRAPGSGTLAPPVLLSGLLYAALAGALAALGALVPSPLAAAAPALAAGGALLFGLAAGAARESSGSVAAPFALHVLGAAALLAATPLGIAG
jgi:membrane protease YdiL (CAAX protease family)